ncbi:hypothetical protein GCM10009681_08630 [Luedemannella helvata]|uniref:Uncharacterized protein n=1 Tax=Luedemannella helvata TaxID=349315 RepID=A0ABP4VZ78_9ACTN
MGTSSTTGDLPHSYSRAARIMVTDYLPVVTEDPSQPAPVMAAVPVMPATGSSSRPNAQPLRFIYRNGRDPGGGTWSAQRSTRGTRTGPGL